MNLIFEFIENDINSAYNIVKAYNNSKINLEMKDKKIKNDEKFDYIKNNIISLKNHDFPANMKNLENLKIDITNIHKIKTRLKKLKHIHITNNALVITNIANKNLLFRLNNIESLELNYEIHLHLSLIKFTNLKELKCSCCTTMKNEDIENLINLESLFLSHNKNISDDAFKNLNKIKKLVLHKTKITSAVLQYLPDIQYWTPDRHVSNDNFENMKIIKKLKLLDLYHNKNISDENIININIEHIILSENHKITINGLNKNIKKIYLVGKVNIKDNDLKQLDLLSLNLVDNEIISDEGLKYCKNLKTLNLFCNCEITDKGLIEMKNLEYLNLKGLSHINNEITDNSLKKLSKLKYLSLENNKNITDEGIKTLVNLEFLNINHNKKITINGILNLKNLREINCMDSLLSEKDLYILVKNNTNLKIIHEFCNEDPKLPALYYSKKKYFVDDYDESTCDIFEIIW